jgi:hypothetical protein
MQGGNMRRYNKWAGNSEGTKEDITRCIVQVSDRGKFSLFYQCRRKRGYGPNNLFCKQHAKLLEKGEHLFIPEEEK